MNNLLKQIPIISILVSGWQFASIGYANDTPKYRKKQKWKIIFHAFLNPIFASKWFKLLKSKDFNHVFSHRPRIYIKPFRVYISTKWNKKQKIKVILDTYRFIKSKGEVFEKILTHREGLIIADITFDSSHTGFLRLGYDDKFRKEGELVLTLESNELGGKIVSAAFSFEEITKGYWSCIIGCVQVHGANSNQSYYKKTQKLMHGLRPNSFIIHSVQELSRHLGCQKIYCTGNSIQVNRKKHAIHLPWFHSINFDYNSFWNEVGGKNINKDWFELPLLPVHKNIQEIKSNKRSMYRKRFGMLNDLSLKISGSTAQNML